MILGNAIWIYNVDVRYFESSMHMKGMKIRLVETV